MAPGEKCYSLFGLIKKKFGRKMAMIEGHNNEKDPLLEFLQDWLLVPWDSSG